jgi:coronin-7
MMRQREIALWDPRALTSPLKKITLTDSSSPSVLTPVVDGDRNIVYLVGRGDTAVRWVELDSSKTFNEGSHPLGPGMEVAGPACLAPQTLCNPMQTEIDRIYVPITSIDGVLPLRVSVPRRQLIDYHEDLFPDTVCYHSTGGEAEKEAAHGWFKGKDGPVPLLSRDPSKYDHQRRNFSTQSTPAAESSSAQTQHRENTAKSVPTPLPTESKLPEASSSAVKAETRELTTEKVQTASPLAQNDTRPPSAQPVKQTHAEQASKALDPTPPRAVKASPQPSSSLPGQRPHWSRRFLAGSTPLISAHQNLSGLDTSTSPDSRAFEVNAKYFFYPVAGPGGRIAFHPLSATGRMPLSPPSIRFTSTFVDFAGDPFNPLRLYTASEDGKVRTWDLPEPTKVVEALNAKDQAAACSVLDLSEPADTLSLPDGVTSARIAEIRPSPVASDVIAAVLSGAEEESRLVVWNRRDPSLISTKVGQKGSFGFSWNPSGDLVAIAGKDKTLRVIDPRKENTGQISAHDSPRSFKTIWIDEQHIISTGHGMGSLRQIKLYRLQRNSGNIELKVLKSLSLDNSPAILFPHYDEDTNVLWLWSKGERSVSAFEVQPEKPSELLTALPAFQAGTPQVAMAFLPKRHANVKAVEIAASYRLSSKDVQRVGFTFSRARPELFQDDIFVPTRDVETPLCSAEEWVAGSNPEPKLISLQPEGMMPRKWAAIASIADGRLISLDLQSRKPLQSRPRPSYQKVRSRRSSRTRRRKTTSWTV